MSALASSRRHARGSYGQLSMQGPKPEDTITAMHAVGRERDGWPVRSKAALLLALVAKRQGPAMLEQLLPQLLSAAGESATHAEMVRPPDPSRAASGHHARECRARSTASVLYAPGGGQLVPVLSGC